MNLSKLIITDDLQEQIRIGRELMDVYDKNELNYVMHQFDGVPVWGGYNNQEEMTCKGIYDYYVYGFTLEQQIYYHLYEKCHDEKKEYMTVKSEFLYKAHLNTVKDQKLLEDKYEAYKLLKPYYKREMVKINGPEDYDVFLDFIHRHPKFVFKPLGLSNTKGVEFVDSTLHDDLKALFDSFMNAGENFRYDYMVNGGILEGAVLEELIEQDKEFGVFSPKSMNAVRIPTVRVNGKIIPYSAWFKIGVTDELIVGEARDAVMAGIDCQTGILNTDAITEKGVVHKVHPVSGIAFKGFQIPRWSELVEMITEAAQKLPKTCNYSGWDAVLTPDKGWVILEGNYWGQLFIQLVEQRGCAKEFGDLIGWHMEEGKFWWQHNIRKIEREAGLHD